MGRNGKDAGNPDGSPERVPDRWGFTKEEAELRRPVKLTTVSDEMEAGVVQSLLASCGIPSRRRNVGVGAFTGVVLGSNRFTLEIDVAAEDLPTAQRLLAARPLSDESAEALVASGDAEPAEVPDEDPVDEEGRKPKDRIQSWGCFRGDRIGDFAHGLRIGVFVAGIIVLLVSIAIALLN